MEDLKGRLSVETETRKFIEGENREMQISQANMQIRVEELSAYTGSLQMSISSYCRGMDQVLPLLENLKTVGTEDELGKL